MRVSLRLFAAVSGAILLLIAGFVAIGYWAVQREPAFYRQALSHEPARLVEASDELLQNTTALVSDAHKAGQWHAVFTAEQINGWLAVDLPKNHPQLLPAEIIDPRVMFKPRRATIGCRLEQAGISTVASLEVELYMARENVLAIRFCKARAGAIPVPLASILERFSAAATDSNLRLEWQQASGDPVALLTLASSKEHGTEFFLEQIELRDGAIYLAGQTESVGKGSSTASKSAPAPEVATQSATKQQDQR